MIAPYAGTLQMRVANQNKNVLSTVISLHKKVTEQGQVLGSHIVDLWSPVSLLPIHVRILLLRGLKSCNLDRQSDSQFPH